MLPNILLHGLENTIGGCGSTQSVWMSISGKVDSFLGFLEMGLSFRPRVSVWVTSLSAFLLRLLVLIPGQSALSA